MYEDIGRSPNTDYLLIAACRERWFLTRVSRAGGVALAP